MEASVTSVRSAAMRAVEVAVVPSPPPAAANSLEKRSPVPMPLLAVDEARWERLRTSTTAEEALSMIVAESAVMLEGEVVAKVVNVPPPSERMPPMPTVRFPVPRDSCRW